MAVVAVESRSSAWAALTLQQPLVIWERCHVMVLVCGPASWAETGFHFSFTASIPARGCHGLGAGRRFVKRRNDWGACVAQSVKRLTLDFQLRS